MSCQWCKGRSVDVKLDAMVSQLIGPSDVCLGDPNTATLVCVLRVSQLVVQGSSIYGRDLLIPLMEDIASPVDLDLHQGGGINRANEMVIYRNDSSGMVMRSSQIAQNLKCSLLSWIGWMGNSITGVGLCNRKILVARNLLISRKICTHSCLVAGTGRPCLPMKARASFLASTCLSRRALLAVELPRPRVSCLREMGSVFHST